MHAVIPGPATGRNRESITIGRATPVPFAVMDSGFGAPRRPGMTRRETATPDGAALDPGYSGGMFVTFFHELKSAGVPVTLREYLTLMEAMEKDIASRRVDEFYYLSRAALVKDERNLDKFDRVFGHVFKGLEFMGESIAVEIPAEWLAKLTEKYLTEEEKKEIEA